MPGTDDVDQQRIVARQWGADHSSVTGYDTWFVLYYHHARRHEGRGYGI